MGGVARSSATRSPWPFASRKLSPSRSSLRPPRAFGAGDVDKLFGPGQLTPEHELSQRASSPVPRRWTWSDQGSASPMCGCWGRPAGSQVEIAADRAVQARRATTDPRSGDLANTPGITLEDRRAVRCWRAGDLRPAPHPHVAGRRPALPPARPLRIGARAHRGRAR